MKKSFFKYIALIILLFILTAFNFHDVIVGSWNPQYIGNVNNRPIADLAFVDSLTGFIITYSLTDYPGLLLKTTNGGNNWFTNLAYDTISYKIIEILNKDTIIVCEYNSLLKTTNKGNNWIRLLYPGAPYGEMGGYYMHALNYDTIWVGAGTGFHQPQLYLTTNGGLNWIKKFELSSGSQFDRVYFYNKRIGFCCSSSNTYKTTNGGENWTQIISEPYLKIQFTDSLMGWLCNTNKAMKKTTDGGYSWVTQTLPSGGNIFRSWMLDFSILNKDSIWGCGGMMYFTGPPTIFRGIIWKTTNGGVNWGYQIPDTGLARFGQYNCIKFYNKQIGWAYSSYNGGIHTTTGGLDSTIYVGIKEQTTNVSSDFILYQNYPNPFNPVTSIKYNVESTKQIKLIVFDILGKEVAVLVNEKKKAGEYEVTFNAASLSSGIYFYALYADGVRMDTKKMVLLK